MKKLPSGFKKLSVDELKQALAVAKQNAKNHPTEQGRNLFKTKARLIDQEIETRK